MEESLNKKDRFWIFLMNLGALCHQRADRSFFYKDYQFPICARCTGVFIGYVLALIYSFNIFTSVIFLSIMGIDWTIQKLNIKQSTNARRFTTGILGGLGYLSIIIKVIP